MRNRKCISHAFIQSSAACLSVIILTLLFALPVSASYYPNDPVGWKDGDTLSSVIYAILDSWGISVSRDQPSDIPVTEFAYQLLDDYIVSSGQVADDIWNGIQLGVNKLGQLIGNNYLVDFCRDFSNWLITKYNLSDNMSVPAYPSSGPSFVTVGGRPCIRLTLNDIFDYDSFVSNNFSGINGEAIVYSFTGQGYIYLTSFQDNNGIHPAVYVPGGFTALTFRSLGTTHSIPYSSASTAYFQAWTASNRILDISGIDPLLFPSQVTLTGIFGDLTIGDPVPTIDLNIDTREIDIPTSTPSDGIIIDVPGTNWGDSLFDILDLIERLIILYDGTQLEVISIIDTLSNLLSTLNTPISVENIPGGVVLNYDDYDLPLDLDWEYVNDFFGDINISKGFTAISDLVYYYRPFRLFFIVIGLTIIAYGFIRMGRDSH